ncbi:acyl-CoA-binding domain-containing protein 1-like protein, partial [Tanacetum coccineum]
MFDWQEIIFGLIFALLVAKLISIITSFRDQNLRITRANQQDEQQLDSQNELEQPLLSNDNINNDDNSDSSDDDWEGVESSELDEAFSAATAFVAATAADKERNKVSNEVQLELYGCYKIATEGPCTAPQPSALKFTARAKVIKPQAFTWVAAGSSFCEKKFSLFKGEVKDANERSSKGLPGQWDLFFSSFIHGKRESDEFVRKLDDIHAFCKKEGDTEELISKSVEGWHCQGDRMHRWDVTCEGLNVIVVYYSRNHFAVKIEALGAVCYGGV